MKDTDYKYGFSTAVEPEDFPKGLNKEIVELISKKRGEPGWLLEFRLKAYDRWKEMTHPEWQHLDFPPIDYQNIYYYSAPKRKAQQQSLGEIDEEIIKTFDRLGIPLQEQKRLAGVAIDAIFDSVSITTTHQEELAAHGVIFCSISEAIRKHPDLVQRYLGSVVPSADNFYAALNSAVFTDGSFCYIPKKTRCPIELSTYFRINAAQSGQFERTLLIADQESYVSYLEGCTAPQRDENQLHAAVVELIALDDAEIKYSTVQNWYAGDADGHGGIYNFVTKRGKCQGRRSKISWTQVEAGAAITWKYPGCILAGDDSEGSFYSVAVTNNRMQADTGTKMVHLGKNTKSTIISKGISTGLAVNSYRGLVLISPRADNARNYSRCDSMLVGDACSANTFPYIDVQNDSGVVEHEASISRIGEDQLFYLQARGLDPEKCISLIINGFCKEIFKTLPLEFSVEAVRLLEMKLENSIA
ncbi:Fe-S cluster assembly protein SufB [Desulfogranum mediterraneum]|uniref:Fe-S cluster assembly protein SufB n=1 Tax=Desulfogranum mediterraneum TaxID=160661 RepID=UPI000400E924|nr:Fe-S cluster assembly protein SufB [Desulfogranum mediterraneum]